MIRVHCLSPGRFMAPLTDPPTLEAPTRAALDEILSRGLHALSPLELAAVRRALEAIGTAQGPVAIAVASGGGVFRLETGAPAVLPEPTLETPPPCWSRHRDALVLAAYDVSSWNERARDALRFLGYAAAVRGDAGTVADGLAAEVAARRPAAVLVGPAGLAREGSQLAETAPTNPSAVILLTPDGNGASAPLPRGVTAVLPLPLRLASLAPLLDEAIDGARAGLLPT